MPVSKKRKKEGKPVHRKAPAAATAAAPAAAGEQPVAPVVHPAHPLQRAGRPSNPFVANAQAKRGAQRGR